jgi:hypothetical protein
MSDEAIFSLNGSVNKQNCRYWAPTNPRPLHERPLHSPQVVVWCAISAQGITGPYFFEGDDSVSVTVNAELYNHMLETFFLPEMRRRNWNMARAWFQQDGATAHMARLSMNTLRAAFPGRLLKFLLTPSLTLTALKMQFVRRLRMLRRTLYVASWQVYLGDGSNALIVMEDISKTLY